MSTIRPSPPRAVVRITRILEDAGFETWAVGGAVRDVLLGQASGDWDLATRARPEEVQRLFHRTVPIGVEHGTVGVLMGGIMYEVTTFRRDVETDGRHAVVSFADDIRDDLARRDFTINAIAWHVVTEEFLDPHGGRDDLRANLLRTVGTARERFTEDYLRILRALRFAGRFGLEMDPGTWEAARDLVGELPGLSPERIREELLKVLDADPAPSGALGLYRASGVLDVLYPELAALPDAVWGRTLAVLDALPRGRPHQRLAALLRPVPRTEAAALLVRLRLSNTQTDETALLAASAPMPAADAGEEPFRRWLSAVGVRRLSALARLELAEARAGEADAAGVVASWRAARAVRAQRPPLTVGDLAVDGRDLIRLGLKPGPHFGRILEGLLDSVLEDPRRNTTDALAVAALALADRLDGDAHG